MTENVRQTAHEPLCRPIVAEHEQDTASDGTGLQNGPEGTMESLAGLRVYVGRHARMDEMTKAALLVYAREIEREVKELTDERDLLKTQWEAGVDFDQRLEACADKREDVTLFGVDYTALPLDADGVPIHVGDVMEADNGTTFEVEHISLYQWGWRCDGKGTDRSGVTCTAHAIPDGCRHHHAPTVEDVLREFAQEMNENLGMYTGEAIDADEWRKADERTIAEYAARLRLAEGVDA